MLPSYEDWVQRLERNSSQRELALMELRELLLLRLHHAFRNQPEFSSNLIEDVVQESLLKILNKLHTFEGRSQFPTWATAIAIRTAYSELRKREWKNISLEQTLTEFDQSRLEPVSDLPAPELSNEKDDLVEALYERIHLDLTVKQKDALLAELKGMPLEEIARRQGSTVNAVYKLTHDARKRLKLSLENNGYTSDDWAAMRT